MISIGINWSARREGPSKVRNKYENKRVLECAVQMGKLYEEDNDVRRKCYARKNKGKKNKKQ